MSDFKCSACGQMHPTSTLGLQCPNSDYKPPLTKRETSAAEAAEITRLLGMRDYDSYSVAVRRVVEQRDALLAALVPLVAMVREDIGHLASFAELRAAETAIAKAKGEAP